MARDRWFKMGAAYHLVPEGSSPARCGIDLRSAIEVPRPPERFELFIAGAWRLDRARKARVEREERLRDPAYVAELEARLGALEALLAEREGGAG
jgi:hypothetical protein